MKTILLLMTVLVLNGCVTFKTALHDKSKEIQTDGTTVQRDITADFTGSALFSSVQEVTKIQSTQTDKTQSFNAEGVRQQGATNVAETIRELNKLLGR